MSKEDDPMIGRVFHGTIEITRLIGAGGMGRVYEGYQKHLDRKVAVKVMTAEHAANPIAAEYFMREARSASRLRHPNIIQIIDFGQEEDDTLFLAMEFVPGKPLTNILKKEAPLAPRRVVEIMSQVLSAMDAAHAEGIIHRDLKPDNIMVERTRDGRDFTKLLDFGVAQIKAPDVKAGPLTMQGAVVGTPQYMSPEQVMGDAVDGRSDLFSLGAILYELLTDKIPFDKPKAHAIMIAILKEEVEPPSARRPDLVIPSSLEAIALRALNKKADLRYQTAGEFRQALIDTLPSLPALDGSSAGAGAGGSSGGKKPTQFVFKRSKKARRKPRSADGSISDVQARPTTGPQADPFRKRKLTDSDVDLMAEHSDLALAVTAATPSPLTPRERSGNWTGAPIADEAASAPPRPITDTSGTRPTSGLGLNLDELRQDLIGERQEIVSLVMHTRHHKRLDPEEMIEVRAQIDHVLRGICERWHAAMHGRQGAFITLAFGLPTPRTDDPMRAGQAALELRAQLDRLKIDGAAFSVALDHGEVFCPSADFSQAAGPPIDDATELARASGDGEILLSKKLTDTLQSTFKIGAQLDDGSRPLLGMREVVVEHQETSQREELIGRDAETAEMLGVLGRVTRKQGTLMVVTGEPGVGKSALIRETLRMAEQRGQLVLRATARLGLAEGIRDIQRQWLLDLMRQRGNANLDVEQMLIEVGADPVHSRLLMGLVRDEVGKAMMVRDTQRGAALAQSAERSLHVSLRGLARTLIKERPLVVCLDGVSTFDEPLQKLLERWSDFAEDNRFLFVCGIQTLPGRPHPELPLTATPVHVEPLEELAAEAYLRVNLPKDYPRDRLRRMARVSGGYPLNLVNLATIARDRPDMSDEDASAWLARSRDVRDVLRMRLYQQPKDSQNVLAALSVLGHGTPATHLLDLVGERWNPERCIQSLHEEGLLDVDGERDSPRLYFVPRSLETLVYDQLSRKMRKRIHERAAGYYDELLYTSTDDRRAARIHLARHLEGSGHTKRALEMRVELALDAMRSHEFSLADEQLDRAIELADVLELPHESARLKLQRVRAWDALGMRRDAIDLATRLDRVQDLPDRLALEIRLERGRLWLDEEDPMMVEQIIKKAVKGFAMMSRETPEDLELFVMSLRATQMQAEVLERQGKLVQAAQVLLQVVDATEARGIDANNNAWGPSLVWAPLNQLGRIRLKLGSTQGAQQLFELALNVARDADDPRGEMRARGNLSAMCGQQGRIDLAQKHLTKALALAKRTGELRDQAKLEHNRGLLLRRQRRIEPARSAFEESMRLSKDLDWREGVALNATQISEIERETQKLNEWES